jgi:hypothetical protein
MAICKWHLAQGFLTIGVFALLAYSLVWDADKPSTARGTGGVVSKALESKVQADQPMKRGTVAKSVSSFFKTYQPPQRIVPAVALILKKIYKNSPDVRISTMNNTTAILVYASNSDQFVIGKLVDFFRIISPVFK